MYNYAYTQKGWPNITKYNMHLYIVAFCVQVLYKTSKLLVNYIDLTIMVLLAGIIQEIHWYF